jgi:hypothetical protein
VGMQSSFLTTLKPSFASEHRRMQPVLEMARKLDIGANPAADALYEAGSAGFQIWCTPSDFPEGWEQAVAKMFPGAFAKDCAYVASVHWRWEGECIVGLNLSTAAYALADTLNERFTDSETRHAVNGKQTIYNRPEDLAWAQKQIHRLFRLAGVPTPPMYIEKE